MKMNKEERRKYIFAQLNSLPNAFQYVEVTNYIKELQQENNQLKEQRQELRSWLENKDNCGYEKIYLKDILIMLNELEGGKND